MALVTGLHPITGLYGSCFLALVFLLQIIVRNKNFVGIMKDFLILSVVGLLSFLIISPWTYMLFEFAEDLVISSEAHVTSFPDSINHFLSRFLPFPLDLRSLVFGFKVEGAIPFLETQANVPLGMLWLWLVYSFVQLKKQQPFQWGQSLSIILSILLFSMITWMSLSTKPYQFLPDYFQNIQFTYRIVFYQNLAIIFAVYSLFQAWPKIQKTHKKQTLVKHFQL